MKYLLFSQQETDSQDGEPMFWIHDFGWGDIYEATRYDSPDGIQIGEMIPEQEGIRLTKAFYVLHPEALPCGLGIEDIIKL